MKRRKLGGESRSMISPNVTTRFGATEAAAESDFGRGIAGGAVAAAGFFPFASLRTASQRSASARISAGSPALAVSADPQKMPFGSRALSSARLERLIPPV